MPRRREGPRCARETRASRRQGLLPLPGIPAAGLPRAIAPDSRAGGLRVSELTSLALADYDRRDPASIRVNGKGRRERILPLWKKTRRALDDWTRLRNPHGDPALFHNRSDRTMTRAGFEYILAKHATMAARAQPSIAEKRVTPHVLRHSCAMHTLQATGDVRKVSLWLGHASIQSTEIYLRADPSEKLEMLAGAELPALRPGRFRAPDKLLALLSERQSP